MTEASKASRITSPFSRFDVEQEVGRGAAGIVYRATDRITGDAVALKVIAHPDADADQRARFLDEGQMLNGIVHPAIVRIVDFGTLGPRDVELAGQRFGPETPYIAMEWLTGTDLQRRHSGTPLTLPETLDCVRQLASALDAAHASGVVHRDVKPSNVFVLDGEPLQVKLVDFGVACASDDMSAMGAMVGTPAYMAPEQARGDVATDPRCDVYSLGATVFELLAGRPPHVGPTPIATLAKVVSTPAPRLSELLVDVPEPLDDLVADMLSLESKDRPVCQQVLDRVKEIAADPQLPHMASIGSQRRDSAHSSASRFITTLVALGVGSGDARNKVLLQMRARGADAVRLGKDAIVAYLGARRAHGGEAVLALELGRTLTAVGARVGVATGRALVELRRPVGAAVDRASALARTAQRGQLLADETSAELARSSFDFAPGPDRSWEVERAIAERGFSREQTPFVGRGNELEALFRSFDQVRRGQRAAVASVSGPPGIGKSRLAREFLRRIDEHTSGDPFDAQVTAQSWSSMLEPPQRLTAPVRVVQARCDAYGRSRALGTAADALMDLMRLPKAASGAEVAEALAPLRLFHDEQGLLSSLLAGEPFGADVDANRARDILYLAMTELVLKVIEDAPCVLLLEDVQWSDPESVAWFDHLLNRAAERSLLLLPLARASFWKDYPRAFADHGHTRVELRPIPRRASMEIARAVMGCDSDDPALKQIAKQAAGSPLFAEELARVFAKGETTADSVPTIEAAIQVSLDALSDNAKDAVMHMAVFGQTAWDDGLGAIGVFDHDEVISTLREADLVVQEAKSRFVGTREYRFKHALVRDVAYASCSDVMRQDLHAQVATWLAGMGEDAATVAEHYDLGGQHQRAAGYWELAARRALTANALVDAVKMADRALAFAEEPREAFSRATLLDEVYLRLDERAAERSDAITAMAENAYDESSEVQTMGAQARYDHARSAGYDVETRLREVVERAAELGLLEEQARCAATLATRHAFAGELRLAQREAGNLLELSKQRGLGWAAIDAWQALAVVRQTGGELAAALDARRNAAKAARSAGLKQREAMLTINLGFALTTIGAGEEARTAIESGIRMATEIGSTGTVRLGRMILLGWAAHFGADPSLDEALAEPRASADEAASGAWIVKDRVTLGVLFYRGCELLRQGGARLRQARALLKMSAEDYRQTDNRDVLPVALGYWAEAERKLGEIERAEAIASEAADLVEAGAPSLLNEAIIYLALHDARVDRNDLSAARLAIERGMPPLMRRVEGLSNTHYVREFIQLEHNAQLLAAADACGCVPEALEPLIAQ